MTASTPKRPRGRPKAETPLNKRLPVVQISDDQLRQYRAAAKRSGQSFSEWVRTHLDLASQ